MRKVFSLIIVFGAIILVNACSVNNTSGPAGRDGIVNVITFFYTINANSWTPVSGDPSTHFHRYNTVNVDSEIINTGAVFVYVATNASTANNWTPLPSTNVFTDSEGVTYSEELIPWHGPGFIEIQHVDSHPYLPLYPNKQLDVKVVVIDGYYINNITPQEALEIEKEYKIKSPN